MRRGLLALLAVLAGLLVAATAAYGSYEVSYPPPAAVKYQGEPVQQTHLYYYTWHYFYSGGEDGSGWVTIGPWKAQQYDWPQKNFVQAGRRVNLVIRFQSKPDKLAVTRAGMVDKNGAPLTRPLPIRHHLYPIKNADGRVIKWGAYFKLSKGDHRIQLRAKWYPDKGTFHSYGTEVRLAHVKAR